MSSPTIETYEENILNQWSDDELERLFELYRIQCDRAKVKATMSDFVIYLQELL